MMENRFGLIFNHFGLAVKKHEKALLFLRGLGYKIGEPVNDKLQNVNLILCMHQTMPAVEVIFQASTPGPLGGILKNDNEKIYHLCYEAESLDTSLLAIREEFKRIITISSPKEAVLFDNRLVSFYYVPGFGVIEILEKRDILG